MSNIKEIIDGWKNYLFKSKEHEKLAINRMSTCLECDKLTKTKRCSECGCFMPAKVRTEKSKCPLGKW